METTEQIEGRARQVFEEHMKPQIDEARRQLGELNQRVVTLIKERPGTVLLGAVALGFIIGRIARR